MSDFKAGDVVSLKSGGPKMTVQDVGDYELRGPGLSAKCVWFEGTRKIDDVFNVETLKLE